MGSDSAISVKGLVKRYGEAEILGGIDFIVPFGTVFGYVGPNGAGKSTTVKILVGMLPEFTGEVRVGGIDVAKDPLGVKRLVGYVPENAALYEALTPLEHLMFVGRLHELDDATTHRRALGMLEALDLGSKASSRISSLSKGMRQKVLLVSALLHDPQILVLDEPLSGLDVHSMIVVKELIHGFAKRGRTIFYCSHVMDVVERVCDCIAILNRGKIAAMGSFDELSRSLEGTSLEDVFRKVTGGGDEAAQAARVLDSIAPGGVATNGNSNG